MARNDKDGELPSLGGEWQSIEGALKVSREMARSAEQSLRSVRPVVTQAYLLSDPRLAGPVTARQSEILRLVAALFRLTKPVPQDIMDLADLYQNLLRRLNGLNRSSFRMVTAEIAEKELGGSNKGETWGFVRPETPDLIFLNETKFSFIGKNDARAVPPPQPKVKKGQRRRGVVTGGEVGMLSSITERGAAILHEGVHSLFGGGAAGTIHRGIQHGDEPPDDNDGTAAFPQIKTYGQAVMDAYVIARFARLIYEGQASGEGQKAAGAGGR